MWGASFMLDLVGTLQKMWAWSFEEHSWQFVHYTVLTHANCVEGTPCNILLFQVTCHLAYQRTKEELWKNTEQFHKHPFFFFTSVISSKLKVLLIWSFEGYIFLRCRYVLNYALQGLEESNMLTLYRWWTSRLVSFHLLNILLRYKVCLETWSQFLSLLSWSSLLLLVPFHFAHCAVFLLVCENFY